MLQIDPEFASKIPPLTEEEFKQLEDNILAEGKVIMPLIVWKDLIVDGHNRYRIICEHPEVEYTTYEKDFPERYSAIAWICKNQLGRRNLTPQQKKYLIGQRYEAEKMAHGASDGFRGNQHSDVVTGQNGPLPDSSGIGDTSHVTRSRIAAETHTNESYVKRAGQYARGVDAAEEAVPGTKEKILSGKIKPTDTAVAAIARAAPEEREEKVKELSFERTKLLPQIDYPMDDTARAEENDDEFEGVSTIEALRIIGDRMATSNAVISLDDIFMELEDAAETMLDRWELCKRMNPELFATKECRTGVRKLVREVTVYLKNFEGGLKQ